ncbi:unnamed protein product [Linum tenue]|uniref:Uncharacterized protein n=1 Tax=Linum tenue TaxID=586396 RepID=A0AAV0LHA9_9ROSI|nr:unnamed protein product [Linum tenue]
MPHTRTLCGGNRRSSSPVPSFAGSEGDDGRRNPIVIKKGNNGVKQIGRVISSFIENIIV